MGGALMAARSWSSLQLLDGDYIGFSRNGSVAMTNWEISSVAKGWLSTLCCWKAAVHTLD